MVERIFVEKKEGFDVEAKGRLADFKETLEIKSLEKVRIFNRYDVENIEKDDLKKSIVSVFSEPAVDVVYKKLPGMEDAYVFAVEYLPGQYDQRADSAAQCVSLLTMKERPTVKTAVVYALFGNLSDEDKEKIKKYVINPVDSREASLEKPKTLQMQINVPKEVDVLDGFIEKSDDELKDLRAQMGFAMSDNDIIFAKNYFAGEKRNPTITEMKVIDTYWSDHCRHTTFQTKLEKVQFGEGAKSEKAAYERYISARKEMGRKKDVCLMDLATMYPREMKGKLPDLDVSEEINACSIKHKLETSEGEKDYLIMFKNETHNHPTEIEPFGGAATCLGGAIRDPLSGRS